MKPLFLGALFGMLLNVSMKVLAAQREMKGLFGWIGFAKLGRWNEDGKIDTGGSEVSFAS